MKIVGIERWTRPVALRRSYAIAGHVKTDATLHFVRLTTDGRHVGVGSASPSERVSHETHEACRAALDAASSGALVGATLDGVEDLERLTGILGRDLASTPAARAALDMALWDLYGRAVGRPVVELLGHTGPTPPRATSITIGIKSADETVAEAREYVARGFTRLKVKLGDDVEVDLERLRRLRETFGREVRIRADANEGYDVAATRRALDAADAHDVEFLEQPLPRDRDADLPRDRLDRVALDESVHTPDDARRLERDGPRCGTWVVKLMKCGGITPAAEIAEVADRTGTALMWGCMDESRISIAASLHAAAASPATRFLDLDGSFELAEDPASGGFELRDGKLYLAGGPGLGVDLTGLDG